MVVPQDEGEREEEKVACTVDASIEALRDGWQRRLARVRAARTSGLSATAASASTAASDLLDAAAAERKLQRVVSKDSFLRMRVVGQFNLGFIIARLDDDLFILDQHACDEKFRFETLQRTTTIHEQRLIRPLPIEVSASEEVIIVEHLDTFRKNGFHFRVQGDAPLSGRLQLVALPFSKHVQFGVDDVHELASMLRDAPGMDIRLPKALAMFASRACRSAIMIGTALSHREMTKVVRQLHGIEQPWNCPHGRPTMRHLVDLTSVVSSKKKAPD